MITDRKVVKHCDKSLSVSLSVMRDDHIVGKVITDENVPGGNMFQPMVKARWTYKNRSRVGRPGN